MRKRTRGADEGHDQDASPTLAPTADCGKKMSEKLSNAICIDHDDMSLLDRYAPARRSITRTDEQQLRPARVVTSLLNRGQQNDGGAKNASYGPRRFLNIDGRQYPFLPTAAAELLLPHQRQGVEFVLRRLLADRSGCILGDYMGLGKTLQVVTAVSIILGTRVFSERCLLEFTGVPQLRKPRPLRIVVVAPGPVVPHWVTEFVRYGQSLQELCGPTSAFSTQRKKRLRAEDGPVRSVTSFRVHGERSRGDERTFEHDRVADGGSPLLSSAGGFGDEAKDSDESLDEAEPIDEADDGSPLLTPKDEDNIRGGSIAKEEKEGHQQKKTRTHRHTAVMVYEHLSEYADRDKLVMAFQRTGGILCISYHQLVRYSPELLRPDILIADEGHRIRNEGTVISGYMSQLKTKLRVMPTGYPLQNNLAELYQLLNFVTSGESSRDDVLGPQQSFKTYFFEPLTLAAMKGLATAKEWELRRGLLLYHRVQRFILRRGLAVLSDLIQLPRSVYLVRLRPTNEQLMAYNWFARNGTCFDIPIIGSQLLLLPLAKVRSRAEINSSTLRQLFAKECQLLASSSPSPKMLLLWSLLKTAKRQSRKVIVFSQFLGSLDECMLFVNEQNIVALNGKDVEQTADPVDGIAINIVRCDGMMSIPSRIANCAAFNDPKSGVDVLAFSLRTGCEGINLTAASLVISLDLSWNPALEHEAFARAYRIGQQKLLDVVMLVVAGSVEEVAYQRQVGKCLLADACVDGELGGTGRLGGSCGTGAAGAPVGNNASKTTAYALLDPETSVEENLGRIPDLRCLELHSILREALSTEPALVHSVTQCSAAVMSSFDNTELDESICRFSVARAETDPAMKSHIERSLHVAEEELKLHRMYGSSWLDVDGKKQVTKVEKTSSAGTCDVLTTFAGDGSAVEVCIGAVDDDDFNFD